MNSPWLLRISCASVLILVPAMAWAVDIVFLPNPAPRVSMFQSNALGSRGAELPVAAPRQALQAMVPWGTFLTDPQAWDTLAGAVGHRGVKDGTSWSLVVIEGKVSCSMDLARIADPPVDDMWLVEDQGKAVALEWMLISILLPPAGAAEDRLLRVVATIKDKKLVEEEYRNGVRISQIHQDARGLAEYEFNYRDGVLIRGGRNVWVKDRLVRTDVYGLKGLQVINHRSYTTNGSLRESWQEYPRGGSDRLSFSFSALLGWSQWLKAPEGEEELFYDQENRLSRKEVWNGKDMVSRTSYQYQSPDSTLLVSVLVEDLQNKTNRLQVYDDLGRMVQTDESRDGRLLARESFLYDDDNHLLLRTLNKDGKTSEWGYDYDNGTLKAERYSEKGVPQWEIRYTAVGHEEDVYVKGVLMVRIQYEGSRKVRQDEYKGGKIVKTKTW